MFVLLFSLLAKMVFHRDQKNDIPMIVMPFSKHSNHDKVNDALISVDRARGEMPVLLVSGTPGYKEAGWCNWYQCIESPPLNSIWPPRTKEAWNAMFAMKAFLKTNRNWLIWMQDDVVVVDLYDLPEHEITCLRVGTKDCGMVAYKMKRWVVEEFVKRIEQEIHCKTIDSILDDLRYDLGLTLHRVGKVKLGASRRANYNHITNQ